MLLILSPQKHEGIIRFRDLGVKFLYQGLVGNIIATILAYNDRDFVNDLLEMGRR